MMSLSDTLLSFDWVNHVNHSMYLSWMKCAIIQNIYVG